MQWILSGSQTKSSMTFDELAIQLQSAQGSGLLLNEPFGISAPKRHLNIMISTGKAGAQLPGILNLPLDYVKRMPGKVLAMLQSKLGLNKVVFARNCRLEKISRSSAEEFLSHYHLMGFTQSAFNYGLFYKQELIAVAAFSKGRKMDRLPAAQRSFELIRFCCQSGVTVTGGLTRLVKNFALEKQAGDIMTYVDKQLSDGKSFISAGFKKAGESAPVEFLIHRATYERTYYNGGAFDSKQFYRCANLGNLKLIYTPGE